MITAYQLEKIFNTEAEAKRIVKEIHPTAEFLLVGIEADKVYFRIVAKQATEEQIDNLLHKTRFGFTKQMTNPVVIFEAWINVL